MNWLKHWRRIIRNCAVKLNIYWIGSTLLITFKELFRSYLTNFPKVIFQSNTSNENSHVNNDDLYWQKINFKRVIKRIHAKEIIVTLKEDLDHYKYLWKTELYKKIENLWTYMENSKNKYGECLFILLNENDSVAKTSREFLLCW